MSNLEYFIKNFPRAFALPQDAHDLTSQADKVQPPLPQMPDGLHNQPDEAKLINSQSSEELKGSSTGAHNQPDESEVRNSQHSEIQQGRNTGSLYRPNILLSLIKSFPFSTFARQPRPAISVSILNYDMFFRWLY
jgi:hypothetical protein